MLFCIVSKVRVSNFVNWLIKAWNSVSLSEWDASEQCMGIVSDFFRDFTLLNNANSIYQRVLSHGCCFTLVPIHWTCALQSDWYAMNCKYGQLRFRGLKVWPWDSSARHENKSAYSNPRPRLLHRYKWIALWTCNITRITLTLHVCSYAPIRNQHLT